VQSTFGSYMAQIAEVEVSKQGDVRVKRVTCAVDCGINVNPNTIEAQVQSGIIYGLTAALYGEITLKNERVEQSNFDTYRALRHERGAGDRRSHRPERGGSWRHGRARNVCASASRR
jgi:isoquinoline 1-oxidoreductase beta subunit